MCLGVVELFRSAGFKARCLRVSIARLSDCAPNPFATSAMLTIAEQPPTHQSVCSCQLKNGHILIRRVPLALPVLDCLHSPIQKGTGKASGTLFQRAVRRMWHLRDVLQWNGLPYYSAVDSSDSVRHFVAHLGGFRVSGAVYVWVVFASMSAGNWNQGMDRAAVSRSGSWDWWRENSADKDSDAGRCRCAADRLGK